VTLSPEAEVAIDPRATFEVVVAARLVDARLVLFDAQDALVPSDGSTELASHTRFTLSPAQPLRPGAAYRLRLEGLARREVRDSRGGLHEAVDLRFRTTGTPPPAQRKPAPSRGR
jgi:hypothetical protein